MHQKCIVFTSFCIINISKFGNESLESEKKLKLKLIINEVESGALAQQIIFENTHATKLWYRLNFIPAMSSILSKRKSLISGDGAGEIGPMSPE